MVHTFPGLRCLKIPWLLDSWTRSTRLTSTQASWVDWGSAPPPKGTSGASSRCEGSQPNIRESCLAASSGEKRASMRPHVIIAIRNVRSLPYQSLNHLHYQVESRPAYGPTCVAMRDARGVRNVHPCDIAGKSSSESKALSPSTQHLSCFMRKRVTMASDAL